MIEIHAAVEPLLGEPVGRGTVSGALVAPDAGAALREAQRRDGASPRPPRPRRQRRRGPQRSRW